MTKNFAYKMGKLAGIMAKHAMPAPPMGNAMTTPMNTPMANAVGAPSAGGMPGAQSNAGAGNANWMRMLMAQKNKAKIQPSTGTPGQAMTTPQPPTM